MEWRGGRCEGEEREDEGGEGERVEGKAKRGKESPFGHDEAHVKMAERR